MENITEKEVKVEEAEDWFNEYDKPHEQREQLPIFEMKLKEGQIARTEEVIFVTDGKAAKTRFGETIVFTIRNAGADKVWFIKKTQYNLLNPIAAKRKAGSIVGKKATVTRAGTGAKETKWALTFA